MQHSFVSLFDLIDYGRYEDARKALEREPMVATERQAFRLLIDVETSNPATASHAAETLLSGKLTDRERLLCALTFGRANAIAGNTDEGCAWLRTAVGIARELRNATLMARCQARLTKTLLRYVGTEAATAEVPTLRKYGHLAGDQRAVGEFHCVAAEIEIKRRAYGRARKHLALAAELCAPSDLAMRGQIGRLTANVALWASDPRAALVAIEPTVKIFEQSGSKYSLVASLSTLAEHHLMVGAFADAERVLRRIGMLIDSREARLNNLDSLMVAALGQNNIAEAAELAARIESLGSFSPDLYSWLWHVTTRAQLSIRKGDNDVAHALLLEYRDCAFRTADERLIARYLLTEAESLTQAEIDSTPAAAQLAYAAVAMPRLTLEDFAEISRIAAGLSTHMTTTFERRSSRIRSLALSDRSHSYPINVIEPVSSSPHEVLQAVASMLIAAEHPELLASETAALLRSTGVCESAVVNTVSIPATNVRGATPRRFATIRISGSGSHEFEIACLPKHDPNAWLSLMAVQILVRGVTELAEGRSRGPTEPSTWPGATGDDENGMIVASAAMTELLNVTRRVAPSSVTVLFTGETGTGKELLARALHDASPRRDKPFIPFNCTAVPRDMLDSQLFGYRRGAFTGAQEAFQGVIRAANGGTLFLDEIGELPLDVQPKLLRFLESGEIHPLGEPRPSTVDVRVVAATNAGLEQLVADGRFRADLFYRLNVVRLPVPPLRERREEIPMIAQHYIDLFSRDARKTGIRLAEETMEYLVLYNWPGNVRQLANEMRRLVALAETGAVLMPEHLSQDIAASRRTVPAAQRPLAQTEVVVRLDQPMSAAFEHVERTMIQYAMKIAEGRLEDAADMLGLSRKGLYLKRVKLKMTGTAPRETEEDKEPVG